MTSSRQLHELCDEEEIWISQLQVHDFTYYIMLESTGDSGLSCHWNTSVSLVAGVAQGWKDKWALQLDVIQIQCLY